MAQPCFAASTGNAFEVIEVGASDGSGRKLLVNLMRPPGSGPFPLAVINHGSPVASKRAEMQIPKFTLLSRWLLAQGYAVALPLRRGYGAVGGRWDETYGPCGRPDFTRGGLETAHDIQAVIDSLSRSDFVRKQGVVVFGQSAGGWGTLALASQNPTNVAGYINFAGGRGGHRNDTANDNCAPDLLVQAAGEYGRTTRRPSLWIYTENDSYFAPALVRQMHSRFVSSGGQAALHILPAVGSDGHQAISNETAFALWSPVVGRFLESLK
jgi:dienelactone hydrolase